MDIAFSNKQFSVLGFFDFYKGLAVELGATREKGPHTGKEMPATCLPSPGILKCSPPLGWSSGIRIDRQ